MKKFPASFLSTFKIVICTSHPTVSMGFHNVYFCFYVILLSSAVLQDKNNYRFCKDKATRVPKRSSFLSLLITSTFTGQGHQHNDQIEIQEETLQNYAKEATKSHRQKMQVGLTYSNQIKLIYNITAAWLVLDMTSKYYAIQRHTRRCWYKRVCD